MTDTEQANGMRTRLLTIAITILICAAMFEIGYLLARTGMVDASLSVWLVVAATALAGLTARRRAERRKHSEAHRRKETEARRRQEIRDRAPGFKTDPSDSDVWRWWDGEQWTAKIGRGLPYGGDLRAGLHPETKQSTGARDGVTLCPIDEKIQYLSCESAQADANKMYKKDGRKLRDYWHSKPEGCELYHLTSQPERHPDKETKALRRQDIVDREPGFKIDPSDYYVLRWWDGEQWTVQIYGSGLPYGGDLRAGLHPETKQSTGARDGVTLCPIDEKIQYLSCESAQADANKIYEKNGRQLEPYWHIPGCKLYHLTSRPRRHPD